MLKYTNTFVTPPNFDFSRDSIMAFITPTIREQVHRIYKTRIFLADNLSPIATSTLLALQNP